jgi:hypothetical protein
MFDDDVSRQVFEENVSHEKEALDKDDNAYSDMICFSRTSRKEKE